MTTLNTSILFDAGMFIGALLGGDTRHAEARPFVECARKGTLDVCTTSGILSEVYAALTWIGGTTTTFSTGSRKCCAVTH